MQRRTLLAALGATLSSVAGCSFGRPAPPSPTSPTPSPVPSRSSPGEACQPRTADGESGESTASPGTEPRRVVWLASVDSVPSESPLVPSVEIVERAVTDTSTARLRVTVTNEASRPVRRHATGTVFGSFIAENHPRGGVVLLPPGYDPEGPGCWRSTLDGQSLRGLGGDVVSPLEYRACERAAVTRLVFGHPRAAACLPTGRYRFVDRFSVHDDSSIGNDDHAAAERFDTDGGERSTTAESVEFEWGFTLAVGRP